MIHDVAIIGGSSAGLAAALTMGRLNRSTILFDTGKPRNRFTAETHNIFSTDGIHPLELLDVTRKEFSKYDAVQLCNKKIIGAEKENGSFVLFAEDNKRYFAKRIILATGLTDLLPEIEGVEDLWGSKVIQCPYCHGWEIKDQPVSMVLDSSRAEHLLPMVYKLNQHINLVLTGELKVSEKFESWLKQHKICSTYANVSSIVNAEDGVHLMLDNGEQINAAAVYLQSEYKFNNELAVCLGCNLTHEGSVVVNEIFETSVPGVFAVGDLSSPAMHQVVFAAASGTNAALSCIMGLTQEEYETY